MQEIIEIKPNHAYRTEIPNIIFELDLTGPQFKLYAFYKRVAGDVGHCYMSKDEIAKRTGICTRTQTTINEKLRRPFEKLGGKSLIRCYGTKRESGGKGTNQILIVDI